MGRKPKGTPESCVERSRGGRFRFRKQFAHEIASWLVMRGARYARAADTAAISAKESGEESSLNLATAYRDRANVCYSLASQISQEWSAVEWLGILANVSQAMGAQPCLQNSNGEAHSHKPSTSSTDHEEKQPGGKSSAL